MYLAINGHYDRPCARLIVAVYPEQGFYQYVDRSVAAHRCQANYAGWEVGGDFCYIKTRVPYFTPLEDFGVIPVISRRGSNQVLQVSPRGICIARYIDGSPRPWQPEDSSGFDYAVLNDSTCRLVIACMAS